MTYLQENDSEELEAPCLPPDMNEEDWRAILGCSYFDLKLSDEENISKEEEPVVDTNDDDDSDADVDGVIDDDGEMGGAVDAVAGGSCNNDQSRNQITGEDAAGRPEANQGVAGSDPKSTAHGPPAIQGSDSGDQDSFQIESSPRSCTRGAMAWESKQAGRETEGQETQAARQERFKNVKAIELDPYTKQLVDYLLSELAARCRQFKINGCANVWILKPGGKSRGRGIRCINKLSAVHQLLHNSNTRRRVGLPPSMWVVQKYIENPLVVHRRKFDIRQWVMVTDWNPLTVWFYDACYVRFAAEDYSLANFENRFSHLTNNSIASKSDQFEQGTALNYEPNGGPCLCCKTACANCL